VQGDRRDRDSLVCVQSIAPGAVNLVTAGRGNDIDLTSGAALGRRHIWWNFVSSSPPRLEAAKQDWAEGRFAAVPGDDEFIPLPDR
jgi:redox-sensitive bicupin YhaK (pirin superfamily)